MSKPTNTTETASEVSIDATKSTTANEADNQASAIKERTSEEPSVKEKIDNGKPLNVLVKQTIESYFAALEGEPPSHLYQLVMKQVEPALLEVVMHYAEGKITKASNVLGIDRGTLSKKLDRYDIDPNQHKPVKKPKPKAK
jgi:Fis family transcriptional regulator